MPSDMKKISIFCATAAMLAMASCSEEKFEGSGEGSLVLSTGVSTDMTVVSRAVEDDIKAGTMVWISRAEGGLVRRYNSLAELPTEAIPMLSGSYIAEAWAGASVSASWDKRWFKGREDFSVQAGQTAHVNIVCKIANVATEVYYKDGLDNYLKDITMTVGHSRASLAYAQDDVFFNGNDGRRAYFMLPSTDTDLTYTIQATQLNGEPFEHEGVIENAQPGYLYKLNVTYTTQSSNVGGAIVTVKIDETEIPVNSQVVELVTPPRITGYDFDIAKPLTSPKGELGNRTVFVSSPVDIVSVVLDSDVLKAIPMMDGGTDVEIADISAEAEAALAAFGINSRFVPSTIGDQAVEKSLFRINLTEEFTNTLADGEYTINVTATDSKNQTAKATLVIKVSDNPVANVEITPADFTSRTAVLNGTVTKSGVESVGFRYRAAGDAEWQYVEGIVGSRAFAVGSNFYAEITGLTPGTTYEYVTVSDDFETEVQRFSTDSEEQVPNASFEEWGMEGKSQILAADYNSIFWDSGNHGATTIGSQYNLTVPDEEYKHSGTYSAKLSSKKVIIKFAAGNLFAGQYLETLGTNGVLGWGRPFTSRPKAMKVWVRYTPVAITDVGGAPAGVSVSKGDMDTGIIYTALVDDTKTTYGSKAWPSVVNTKTQEFFDKNGANVIAYGEHVFSEATSGDGMVEITIPLDYAIKDKVPSNIILVASASRYGDYFTGGSGSTMWVDDIEFIHE